MSFDLMRDGRVYRLHTINSDRVDMLADALFSERFVKGQGALGAVVGDVTSMCCLGVGCTIARVAGLYLPLGTMNSSDPDRMLVTYDSAFAYMPERVKSWYGFTSENPLIPLLKPEYDGMGNVTDHTLVWYNAGMVNDLGVNGITNDGNGGPEDSFLPTIAPAFRRLAKLAREYQANMSTVAAGQNA